jgi:hypothetical protein
MHATSGRGCAAAAPGGRQAGASPPYPATRGRHGSLVVVLSEMRNSRGRPTVGIRALAIVLALLLAGPLTLLVLQTAARVLDLAL